MKPAVQTTMPTARPETHDRSAPSQPGSHWNALKHGLYAEAILLPGDDVAEFRRQRLAMFETYRPQTEDEAEIVESLAEFRWLRQRCRPVQAQYDAQSVTPATDAAGRVCEPDGHQRLHSTIDVTKHRQRTERLWNHARARLMEAQKQRRQGLVEGAVKLPAGCYMDSSGEVMGPVVPRIPAGAMQTDKMETRDSGDGEIRKNWEEKEKDGEAGQIAGHTNLEPGQAVLSGAVLLGASGKPPALARPTGPGPGKVELPGASGERAMPRRAVPRGRLIGGVGMRRIFESDFRVPERFAKGKGGPWDAVG